LVTLVVLRSILRELCPLLTMVYDSEPSHDQSPQGAELDMQTSEMMVDISRAEYVLAAIWMFEM
jgi:hypothetical protein